MSGGNQAPAPNSRSLLPRLCPHAIVLLLGVILPVAMVLGVPAPDQTNPVRDARTDPRSRFTGILVRLNPMAQMAPDLATVGFDSADDRIEVTLLRPVPDNTYTCQGTQCQIPRQPFLQDRCEHGTHSRAPPGPKAT
jgi:hypothetical protein